MSVKASIVGNVGEVGKTESGKTRFSVASGNVWYTVIGDVNPPRVGDRVEVTGDLVLGEPWQGKSQATIFIGNGLDVFPKYDKPTSDAKPDSDEDKFELGFIYSSTMW